MKKVMIFLLVMVLIVSLVACSGNDGAAVTSVSGAAVQPAAGVQPTSAVAAVTPAGSAAQALAENQQVHAQSGDYAWDSSAVVSIALNGDSIAAQGAGVSVDGSRVTIRAAGVYSLSGSLADGQIIVDTQDEEVVRLILNGVDLHCSSSSPLYVANAKEVAIMLADNTQNVVTDGSAYVFANPEEAEPNAAIFSKADLTIYGGGSLAVTGNYNDGISSKDGLLINGGMLTVTAVDDGMRGKDYLVIESGRLTVDAQGDGLKSDNAEEAERGYVSIQGGVVQVTSGGNAIQAETDVLVTDGEITLQAGGGSSRQPSTDISTKGISAVVNLNIDGGTLSIDASDDALHSNGSLVINGGTFLLATGDDGLHSDATLEINAGDIRVTKSYEGIESAVITINNGSIHVVSSDDGINVASGNDGSGMMGPRGGPGGGGDWGGWGNDQFTYNGDYYLYVNGGYIAVDAAGDGLDINGAIVMTGGVVLVNGPVENMNGALDFDGGFQMTGGFLAAAGSAGMAQAPGSYSEQNSVLVYFSAAQQAGSLVHIQNSAGEDILTFAPTKRYQALVLSSPALVKGQAYTIYTGGSSSGALSDSLYQGGSYTPGSEYASFTVAGALTTVGNGGGGRPGRP